MPDDDESRELRAFHAVLERLRPELDGAVEDAARSIPVFAKLLENMDPAVREQQTTLSRSLERAALLEGEWEPYLQNVRGQGATYAHMGIAFADWYRLLGPYREVIAKTVVPADLEPAHTVIAGMGTFVDRTMATIGEAYVETTKQLLRKTERDLDLYIQDFQSSPMGKLIYEWEAPPDRASFRLVMANPAATALTGGRALSSLDETVPQLVASGTAEHCALAIETGEAQAWTARRAGEDGRERVYDCKAFALGHGFVGVAFEDVSERYRMQDELARNARELERSNRELDDFAYVASHDLKAPLRDIDTLATWISEDGAEVLPARCQRYLTTLRGRIARMERLLDDLLGYSRAARVFQEPEELELRRVVDDAVATVAPPPGFVVCVEGEVPKARTPRVPLELVLRNLIANAVKHHDREDGRITIRLRSLGAFAEIWVEDDGPGISPEFHERIFRMFQTLRPRDELEGSGIGLATVKKVVEAHGGSVGLRSALGAGAAFYFTWPLLWERNGR